MPTTQTTPHPCDCHHPITGGPVPGALWPFGINGDGSRPWVEACGDCETFASDEDAAAAIATAIGTTVAFAVPSGLEDLHPFVDLPAPEITTIHVVRPVDPSQELAAFTDEVDAQRFAETFTGGAPGFCGPDAEEVTLCSGVLARQMTTDRRLSQYEDLGESAVNEIDAIDLGRYVVSCGSSAGRRECVHVTAEDESQALDAAADLIPEGWLPHEIHDLNAGESRRLELTTAIQPIA